MECTGCSAQMLAAGSFRGGDYEERSVVPGAGHSCSIQLQNKPATGYSQALHQQG